MVTIRIKQSASLTALLIGAVIALSFWGVNAVAQSGEKQSHAEVIASVDLSQPLTVGWRYESNETLNLTPAADHQRIYLPLSGGTIVSLMSSTGQLVWRSDMGGEFSASPVADDRAVYVATETAKPEPTTRRATGAVRALGREGGVTLWMRTLAMPLRGNLTLANSKLFAGTAEGKVYAFSALNGEVRWMYDYGSAFNSQPIVSGSRVYIGSEDGSLLALDEASGKLLWRYKTKGAIRGPAANGTDLVYFGSGDNYLYALNAADGRLVWRKRTGAAVQAVARVGEEILAASLDNFVYKFSLNGKRLWKRRLPGRISSQPLVTQTAALFMPFSSSSAVVLELRDGHQVNLLPTGEEIATSAAPVAVGEVILLTTEHGLLAFSQPSNKAVVQ